MSWVDVLYAGIGPGLYFGVIGISALVCWIEDLGRERRRRPLTAAQQYRVMRDRKEDTIRRLHEVVRETRGPSRRDTRRR